MMPTIPAPYAGCGYAFPHAALKYAHYIPTRDGAELATFVYGPEQAELSELLDAAPVLALHGNGGSHTTFVKVIERLVSAGKAVIAFDGRAQGQSSRGELPLTYELFAEDAIAVLDALGVATAHVVGHSDGGIEALLLARDYPSRTLSIVAGGANITPDAVIDEWDTPGSVATARAWASYADAAEAFSADIDPALLPSAADAQRDAELLQLMLDEPHIEVSSLSSIGCPTCVLVGEHDCIERAQTEQIASAIPGARLVTIPELGHSLPRQAPDSVACQVLLNIVLV